MDDSQSQDSPADLLTIDRNELDDVLRRLMSPNENLEITHTNSKGSNNICENTDGLALAPIRQNPAIGASCSISEMVNSQMAEPSSPVAGPSVENRGNVSTGQDALDDFQKSLFDELGDELTESGNLLLGFCLSIYINRIFSLN